MYRNALDGMFLKLEKGIVMELEINAYWIGWNLLYGIGFVELKRK